MMDASADPMRVFGRHAVQLLERLHRFAAVRPQWPVGLVSVRHATPKGEDMIVGTRHEIEALLRASKIDDVATQIATTATDAERSRTFLVAIIHDMSHPPVLLEVPAS